MLGKFFIFVITLMWAYPVVAALLALAYCYKYLSDLRMGKTDGAIFKIYDNLSMDPVKNLIRIFLSLELPMLILASITYAKLTGHIGAFLILLGAIAAICFIYTETAKRAAAIRENQSGS